jgi:hypothetical protein
MRRERSSSSPRASISGKRAAVSQGPHLTDKEPPTHERLLFVARLNALATRIPPAAFRVQGDLRRSVYVLAHDDGRVIDVDEGLARRDAWITASGTGGVAGGRGKTHRTRSRFNTG